MRTARRPHAMARARQRGDILLVTLVFLLVALLGLVYAMREGLVNTMITGNHLARQKSVQAADLALRQLEATVLQTYAGKPLELSGYTQAWYRDVAGGTAPPGTAYWASCLGNGNANARCASLPVTAGGAALPYTVLVVVQPTGRTDAAACGQTQFQAVWYDLFVRVQEANGATAVTTETVYKLCTLT